MECCETCGKPFDDEGVAVLIPNDEDLKEFVFEELVARGYAPKTKVIEVFTDIFMDYMLELIYEQSRPKEEGQED